MWEPHARQTRAGKEAGEDSDTVSPTTQAAPIKRGVWQDRSGPQLKHGPLGSCQVQTQAEWPLSIWPDDQHVHSAVPMLLGDEPPEGPNQDASLHLRLLQSIRGDPFGPHRPVETRCTRQHVHPGSDRCVFKVGWAIGVSFMHIPAYGTLRYTRGRSHRPWNSFS